MRAYVLFVAGDNDPLHRRWLEELKEEMAERGAMVTDSFISPNRKHLEGMLEEKSAALGGEVIG